MKVILSNDKEVVLSRANRGYSFENGEYNLMLVLPASVKIDEAVSVFSRENCESITLRRDGYEDVVLQGYVLDSINEDISGGMGNGISISLRMKEEN